eukprot:TRINITY_DN2696_c0_g1_i5.p1 TRINITY_DN2696_c0_g1~~TRINITY_DN2696_c0_g1_i5.p1  ORF type:complete len:177 (+),score=65.60 TRINITY_DN2696_c0_g1_i5:126-656(+)
MEAEIRFRTKDGDVSASEKLCDCSTLLKTMNKNEPYPVNAKAEVVSKIVGLYTAANFKLPKGKSPIRETDFLKNLTYDGNLEVIKNFFEGHTPFSVKDILEAARLLQLNDLRDLIVTYIVSEFYVGDEAARATEITEKYRIKEGEPNRQVTYEDIDAIHREFRFLIDKEVLPEGFA